MSRLLVALTLFCSGVTAYASTEPTETGMRTYAHKLSEQELELIKRSQDIQKGQGAISQDPLYQINIDEVLNKKKLSQATTEARELADEIMLKHAPAPMLDNNFEPVRGDQPQPVPYTQHNVLVFASVSLGKQGLNDLLEMVAGHEDTVVVFRGIHQHETMTQAMRRLHGYLAEFDPIPNIIIDPGLFRSYKIDAVPSIVITDPDNPPLAGEPAPVIAKVDGLSDPVWLKKAVERGELGELGIKGPLEDIAEVDLIELAQHRASLIDWEAKKERAINNYWFNQRFTVLERALKPRKRLIDPSVIITQDIKTPDGTYVAREGDVINPLKIRAFTQAVVVFDPLDSKQMELVKREAKRLQAREDIAFITYIATQLDRNEGWDSYKKITDEIDEHIYLLTPELASRFELEFVPSVITSAGEVFDVTELAEPNDLPLDKEVSDA